MDSIDHSSYQIYSIDLEYAGHARDFVKTININDWSGIVLASGDGLIYEVGFLKIFI